MKKLLHGHALKDRAVELDVSLHSSNDNAGQNDAILQQTVIEAERPAGENKLWIMALISAISDLVSAIGSWCAI